MPSSEERHSKENVQAPHDPALVGVNAVLDNIKNALHGTYHALLHKYLQRYLSEFCYQFNRRFELAALVSLLPSTLSTARHSMKAATLALVLIALPAAASGATVVYPTGNPAHDVPAVRAAVEGGGTVLLKSVDVSGEPCAFHFGDFPVGGINWDVDGASYVGLGVWGEIVPLPRGGGRTIYVSIGNDVRLQGETINGAKTTIRGGAIPIRNFAPRTVPDAGEQVVYGVASLAVEGIRFEGSALQSMYTFQYGWLPAVQALLEGRGLEVSIEIRRNDFIDVQPAYDWFWYSLAAVTDGPAGRVLVEDNVVRFTPGRWDALERAFELANGLPPTSELWEGFSIADLNGPGRMARNSVHGVDVGLLVYFDGNEVVHIVQNNIELREEALVGIQAAANHTYLIERNTVIAPGSLPDGILLWPTDQAAGINGSTIRHNQVTLSGSDFGGISLVGSGADNYIAGNAVEGDGAYAFALWADFFGGEGLAVENSFAGNQISRFTPRDSFYFGPGVHFLFDTHTRYNTVIGKSGAVLDLGEGNFITGSAANDRGPGQPLAGALAAKRDLLRQLRRTQYPRLP